jgi:MYXO-CTERM domain-containing protein
LNRRTQVASLFGAAVALTSLPAFGAVINVSPADGNTAYTKIEGAVAGDEVVIAPGTYAFRVYLQAQGSLSQPIYIHAQDPANPPVWDLSGTLVEDAPGSYTAPDKNRGCWQVSGGTNYHIDGIVFENCHAGDYDSAGLRYYSGTTGLLITNCLFQDNDNGLTGGTGGSDATVEFSEFSQNGNLGASTSSPTHNVYIYGGTFAMRYSYLHDPLQAENLHCRAVSSTIEYNWFDRAKVYEGDLMTSDDYANNPVGSLAQTMILRGNVIIEAAAQSNQSQIWAVYNDEASGSPVSFSITALYNTVISDGGHGAFIHVSNADGTQMTAEADDNIISGTSQPILVEDLANATVTGKNNWLQTGASLTGLSGVTGSIFGAAAGFTNATAYDFSLAAGSPCIGVADTAVGNLPVDEYYENETVTRMYRVRATAMDVGAFEHTTTGPGIGPYGSDGGVAIAPDAGGPSDAGAVDATADDSGTVATGTPPEADGGAPEGGSIDAGELPGGGEGPSGHTGSSGGCGCRVTRDGSGGGPWALALAGPAVAIVRRRRRR